MTKVVYMTEPFSRPVFMVGSQGMIWKPIYANESLHEPSTCVTLTWVREILGYKFVVLNLSTNIYISMVFMIASYVLKPVCIIKLCYNTDNFACNLIYLILKNAVLFIYLTTKNQMKHTFDASTLFQIWLSSEKWHFRW